MPDPGAQVDFTKAMSRVPPDQQAAVARMAADPESWQAMMNLILLQQVLLRDEVADA